jgi:transcriptional regulator with XRE-family HTH domain
VDEDLLRTTLARIAANVRRLRTEQQLTQAELAERANVDLRYLQRVEAATVNAGASYVAALAHALGVEAGALFVAADALDRPPGRPRKG